MTLLIAHTAFELNILCFCLDESAKTPGETQGHIPSDNPHRAIIAKALSGHWVQIRLDEERPASFEVTLLFF